jgi:hypothetical protein
MSTTPTLTPNLNLQVPGVNQPNWNAAIVYDLNLIDSLFSPSTQPLTKSLFVAEKLSSVNNYTFNATYSPALVMGIFIGGLYIPPTQYTVSGNTFTFSFDVTSDVWCIYFQPFA